MRTTSVSKRHYDYADLVIQFGTITIKLADSETAWMAGTSKSWYHGPGEVTYTFHPDGGVDSTTTTATRVPATD